MNGSWSGRTPGRAVDQRLADARRFVDNLEAQWARLRPGESAPDLGSVEGKDATGAVYCVLAGEGTVTQVGLESGWWDLVGPTRVAAAIWEAVRFAQSKRAMATLLARRLGLRPHDQDPVLGQSSRPVLPRDHDVSWSALLRRIDEALTILEQIERTRERLAVYEHERRLVTGANGLVTVELEGPRILGLRVDERRVTAGDAGRLGRDAVEVLGRTTGPRSLAALREVLHV